MAGLTKSLGEPDGRDFLIVDEPGGGSFEQQFLRVKQLVREMHRQGKAVGSGLSSQNAYLDQDGKCMIVENNSYNPTFIIHEAPATWPLHATRSSKYHLICTCVNSKIFLWRFAYFH